MQTPRHFHKARTRGGRLPWSCIGRVLWLPWCRAAFTIRQAKCGAGLKDTRAWLADFSFYVAAWVRLIYAVSLHFLKNNYIKFEVKYVVYWYNTLCGPYYTAPKMLEVYIYNIPSGSFLNFDKFRSAKRWEQVCIEWRPEKRPARICLHGPPPSVIFKFHPNSIHVLHFLWNDWKKCTRDG